MPHAALTSDALRRTTPVVVGAQVAAQGVSLAVLAALWRLLGLGPYGLLNMVLPLVFLLRIFFTGGLDVATIQEPTLDHRRLSALFWLSQVLGLAMAAVTAGCAPLLAWFYGEPDLFPLTLALAGLPLATVLGSQHLALLQHRLRLGSVAVLRLAALAVAGLAAVLAALDGWGVWALVVQQYAEPLTVAAGAWLLEGWRPAFVLRRTGAAPLVRFGGYYTGASLMFYLTTNVDKVLVGYFLGREALGLYSQAFNVMMRPVHAIIAPLTGLMMPALSRARGAGALTPGPSPATGRGEYEVLLRGFFRFIALVMFPAGVGLCIVAPETVRVLGGPDWAPAGIVLAVLAPALLAQGFFNALGSVFVSSGRADRLFYASALIAAAFVVAFVVGLGAGNAAGQPLVGMGVGYTLAMLAIVFPPYLAVALRTANVPTGPVLGALRPAALATLGMGLLVAITHLILGGWLAMPDLPLLGSEVLIGAAVYAFLARGEIGWLLRGRQVA